MFIAYARDMNNEEQWSRLEGFFNLSLMNRRKVLSSLPVEISEDDFLSLDAGLSLSCADLMSENVVATFGLPFSIAANFVIDGMPVLVPMVTEEPSIVAACSKIAKLVGQNGGFFTKIDRALIKGQIQIYRLRDTDKAVNDFHHAKLELLDFAKALCVRMEQRGGGLVDIAMRILPSATIGPMAIIEPVFDVVDAMGANFVNTVLEALAKKVAVIIDGQLGLRILSNLSDQRLARARCHISLESLSEVVRVNDGLMVGEKIIAAQAFAEADVYRACTHNKGILNGIDAVALATGNDFRAIEAGAHAFASLKGAYRPLTSMWIDDKEAMLIAELALPLAVGVVGGLVGIHRGVAFAHKLLSSFSKTSKGLASVMVSVGLSQCLAALLALSQDGIQKGHMKLHQKKLEGLTKTRHATHRKKFLG